MMANIVIVGQGAIGLLWYFHLHKQDGCNLSLRASTPAWRAVTQMQFSHFGGLSEQCPLHHASDSDIQAADIILVAVKSYQVATALADLTGKLKPGASIILSHNGMGTTEQAVALLGPNQPLLLLLTTHGCMKASPRHVLHTGFGQSQLGLLNGLPQHPQQITALLDQALPTVRWQQDIVQQQWLKLAINCVINPLTAINNVDNGAINQAKYTAQIAAIIDELVTVARAEHILLDAASLRDNVKRVANLTAGNCSSMRADILGKRRTEIDYINGFIARLGQKQHIATPVNTALWQQVKRLEQSFTC